MANSPSFTDICVGAGMIQMFLSPTLGEEHPIKAIRPHKNSAYTSVILFMFIILIRLIARQKYINSLR